MADGGPGEKVVLPMATPMWLVELVHGNIRRQCKSNVREVSCIEFASRIFPDHDAWRIHGHATRGESKKLRDIGQKEAESPGGG